MDFREGYETVYGDGSWDPARVVTVVEFTYVSEERSNGDDTDQEDGQS